MMRPPPGATPPHSDRTSLLHADRNTNSSSRGRIGRSTSTVGAAAGAGAPGLAGAGGGAAPGTAAGARCPPSRRRCRAAAGRVDGLLTGRRNLRLVLFQALQRRSAASRHAGADFLVVGAAW